MNNELSSEKSQDVNKITTIIMNKKMSLVSTLSDYTTMSHLCITPCADSCLEQPLHAIVEQNIKMLIKGVLNQGQSPQRTPLLYAHMHT